MGDFLEKNGRLFAVLGLLFVGSGALAFRFDPDPDTLLITVVLFCVIGILALLLFRQQAAPKSQAVAAMKIIAGMTATFPGWPSLTRMIAPLLGFQAPAPVWQSQLIFLGVFIAACLTICVIAFVMGRPPLDPAKTGPVSPFQERTYRDRFPMAAEIMRRRLDGMDYESNWTDRNFEPLDAEVEEISQTRRRTRRVGDLLSAIKRDRKTRVFLVIGEPGSGKSTALRKLAKDLLDAAPRTGILPLYINLREWKGSILPTGEPPTAEDLFRFISDQVTKVGDIFVSEFFDAHLRAMIDHGRIFFIFDSFDEIPILLDEDETSGLISEISQLVGNMASGAAQARGVIASRPYRRPRLTATEYKHLEVRPFSESKIRGALLRNTGLTEKTVNGFMRGPPRWIASARNPFVANLICQYLKTSTRETPESQVSLYETYIDGRLGRIERDMTEMGLTLPEVKDAASRIAQFMFSTQGVGLEASNRELQRAGFAFALDDILYILVSAKIIRQGSGPDRSVSFVHRRFYEYFLVQYLRQQDRIDLTAIEEDRRERDALVLYAEIADDAHAAQIVQHCWSFIEAAWIERDASIQPSAQDVLRATYCLRFLIDAFSRTGSPALRGIEQQLKGLLEAHIEQSFEDPLTAKISVEASGLFDDDASAKLIEQALIVGEPWVAETAIRSCRYVSSDSEDLRKRAEYFIFNAPDQSILRLGRDFGGLFDAADIIRPLKRLFYLRLLHIYIRGHFITLGFFLSPIITAYVYVMDSFFDSARSLEKFNRLFPFGGLLAQSMMFLFSIYTVADISSFKYDKGLIAAISNSDNIYVAALSPAYYIIGKYISLEVMLSISVVFTAMAFDFMSIGKIFIAISSIIKFIVEILSKPIYNIKKYHKILMKFFSSTSIKQILKFALAAVVGIIAIVISVLVLVGAFYVIYKLGERYAPWLVYVLPVLLGVLMSAVLARMAWRRTRQWIARSTDEWRDKRHFADLRLRHLKTREEIAFAFTSPCSEKGRLNVTVELGLRSRQEGWRPTGEWPLGRLPAQGDSASSELARLEEQWRGLDR